MNERADRSGGAAPGRPDPPRPGPGRRRVPGGPVDLGVPGPAGRPAHPGGAARRHLHPPPRARQQRPHDGDLPGGRHRAGHPQGRRHAGRQPRHPPGADPGRRRGEWLFKQIDPGGGLARFSPSSWCLCSQNDLEPELLTHATNLGGDLRFGTELLSFEADTEGVTAIVKSRETGEHTTIRADYLVAADGPRSPVREQLGIGQSGPGDLFHNVSITFRSHRLADVVGDRRFIVCYLTDENADGALLPVDNRENWVFHAPWHPEQGETVEDFTDERCAAHIRRAIGDPDLDVEITGKAPWHAAQRVARSYRSGRVLLAGDSAHEMSPTGAFGSNTGIQDAHNLAWKLAAVLEGWAGEALLDTYDTERRPVAEATSARAAHRSVEHSHPGFAPPPVVGVAVRARVLPAVRAVAPVGLAVLAVPAAPAVLAASVVLAVPAAPVVLAVLGVRVVRLVAVPAAAARSAGSSTSPSATATPGARSSAPTRRPRWSRRASTSPEHPAAGLPTSGCAGARTACPPWTSTRTPSSCSATPPSPPAGTRRPPGWPPGCGSR